MPKEGCFSKIASLCHFLLWHSSYWIKNPAPKDWCLFLCVNVIWLCAHMNAELCTLTCMCKGHRSWWIIFLCCSPFKIFETGSLTERQSCQLSEAGLLGTPPWPAPQCRLWTHSPTTLFCFVYLQQRGEQGGAGGRELRQDFLSPRLPLNPDLLPSYSHGTGAQACVTRICFQHDYWQIFKVTVC